MSNKIILKKSSVITANNPKLPQPSDLEYGELAVNYADSHETITLKNSNNEIVQIKSKEYNDANYAPKSHTHDEYLTTPMIATYTYDGYHNDAILAGFLNGDDNVETTNGAIIVLINKSGTDATIENSVNVECKGHGNITYTVQTDMPAFVVKDGESVSFVVMGNTLTPLISVAPGCVTKEYVDGVIEDNELVVAGALNELNDSLTLKAEIDHNHDDVYSPIGHTHTKITNYGICETPGNDSQKVVTIDGFQREEGVQVRVKFTNADTSNSTRIYLNVSNTGNAVISCNGSNISTAANSTNLYRFNNTDIYTFTFTYSGTTPYWVLEDKNPVIHATSSNANYPLIFTSSVLPDQAIAPGNKALYTDRANNMYYNPYSNTLTVGNINGLASSATTATYATTAGSATTASSATTATNANILNTLNTIDGVNYNGSADVSHYVTCTDGGSTIAKTVAHPSFKLVTGARVSV